MIRIRPPAIIRGSHPLGGPGVHGRFLPWEEATPVTPKKKTEAKSPIPKRTARLIEEAQARKRPDHSSAYDAALAEYASGLELLRRKDFAQALGKFEIAERSSKEEPELAERARTYALLCRRRLAPSAPGPANAEQFYLTGVVRSNCGHPDEAVRLFNEALRMEPGSSRILYARAAAWALQGNAGAAVTDLRTAVASDSTVRFHAASDPDFEKIRDEAQFIDVIEPTPTGA